MVRLRKVAIGIFAVLVVFSMAKVSRAALLEFSDTITYHNDVYYHGFIMNSTGAVDIWTDSFMSAANFDPILAVWDSGGNLIAQNDDNPSVGPGQTYWDAGIQLAALTAGNYTLSIGSFDNFANGTTLAAGFRHDGETPILIQNWWSLGTGYYHINVQGDVSSAVPEPATMLLLGSGLVGLGMARKRFKG